MESDDAKWIIIVVAITAFTMGFLVASAIYDKRPITEEEYYESQKQQWYE